MSFTTEKGSERRRMADEGAEVEKNQPRSKGRGKRPLTPEVGSALRNAYQRTINEDIPPEMLDLLGKLG